jgi:threonine synthase
VFILFPKGRVSPVQQRQMTSVAEPNVHAIAVEGSFDDCQAIVKTLFGRERFRRAVSLAAVNSINWARIVAQTVYYFVAGSALGAPGRPLRFTVPTGNFGDIFAGYVAREMGLPIEQLVIATNRNDILARTFQTGRYELKNVVPTASPSMDIQVSSNFERLLAESYGRDGSSVRALMGSLSQSGSFAIADGPLAGMKELFAAGRADESETAAALRKTREETGYLADPHTSVGLAVAARAKPSSAPMVTLATAHPAKFAEAVRAASGVTPELPPHLADLVTRKERYATLANDARAVEDYIMQHARAASLEV